MKIRIVEPEILDSLPEDHPDAISNRKDILLINHLQGNFRWVARQLKTLAEKGEGLIELGAGAGDLGDYLQRKKALDPAIHQYTGLDLWKRPDIWPGQWHWIQEDMTKFDGFSTTPLIVGNLILHQFDDAFLESLGERFQESARAIVICEPLRSATGLLGLNLLRLKGLNYVSVHDGAVSIRAGFRRGELPALLGLDSSDWAIDEQETLLGAYRMVALRK